MAVRRGTYVRKDATAGTSPQDARLAVAGLVTGAGDLAAQPGVISGCVVSGMAAWTYSVGAGHFASTRGASDGAVVAAVDGATTTSAVAAAPATGSRWDLIWLRQRDVDNGDADSQAVVGVTQGVSGGSPTKPYGSVPAGALVVAESQVAAGATQTSHANVTITQVAPIIAARGGFAQATTVAERNRASYGTTTVPALVSLAGDLYRGVGATFTPIGHGQTVAAGFTATGIGAGQVLNSQIAGFVVPGVVNHYVRLQVTAWLFNGANAGNYTLWFRQATVPIAEAQVPYGNGYGDRRTVTFEFVASIAPGTHTFDVVSASGSASAGYDTAKTCQFTVTDMGPVS